MARKKIEIDWETVKKLCEMQCTQAEICGFLEISEEISKNEQVVSDIWSEKFEEYFKYFDFTFEDERILLDFGNTLGKGDVDEEIRNINLTIERLKTMLVTANEEKTKYAKLYRTLGGIGGTALAIILV